MFNGYKWIVCLYTFFSSVLLVDVVRSGFLHLCAGDEGLHAVALGVDLDLRQEEHVDVLYVAACGEVLSCVGRRCGYAQLEGSEAVYLHLHRVLELCGHRVDQLAYHRQNVRALHGTVVLHDVGEVVGGHCSFVYGACIPFAVECVLTVALIDFVLNCHNVFSFLCVLMVRLFGEIVACRCRRPVVVPSGSVDREPCRL